MPEADVEVLARGVLCGKRCKARFLVTILGSIGMGIIYGLKVNLHVAIVSMVKSTGEHGGSVGSSECASGSSNTTLKQEEEGPFAWSSDVQGLVLSSYFWGYILAQIPGGRLAELLSAKWVMFFAVVLNVACALLTPLGSTLHWGILLGLRVLQGIGGGVTFPAEHVLLAHWAPPAERSFMSSIVYAGTSLGSVIFMLFAGLIAGSLGWQWVFYLEGGISLLWCIFWIIFVADTPQQLKYISEEERKYITSSLGENVGDHHNKNKKIPLKKIFTSGPFWAILVAHTCSNWGWYMVLIELPMYLKTVLAFQIKENAVLNAIPYFCMWIFSMLLSKILDISKEKGKINNTWARKTATLIASVVPSICFIAVMYIGCQRALAVALMTVAITAIAGMFSGFLANHIDIAPNFAGTLMGITNSVATIPGIIVPIFVAKITEHDSSINSWRIIFWVTVVLYVIEMVVYTIFGSGEVQSWNNQPDSDTSERTPLKPTTKDDKPQGN